MNEEPRSLLIQIIDTYSLDVINDRIRLGNLLNDYFQGNYRKEKNTLIASLEEGIPADLIKTHTSIPVPALVGQLVRRLTENRGISDDLAVWTVTTWAQALHIHIETGPTPPPQTTRTVSLTVNTTPPDAKVFINSHYVGIAPLTVTSIPAGSTYIQCVLDGYGEWKKTYDFDSSTPTYSITATLAQLAPKSAWVFTASNPPGALIYLDGTLKGNTPLSIPDLQPGKHTVKFSLYGYRAWEDTLTLQPGQLLNVHANLVKESNEGSVGVLSQPPGAACFIDDRYQGIVPLVFSGIPAGKHRVRCTFKGYNDITQTVEVKPGRTTDLTFTFSPTLPDRACDYCKRVQPLPFTCTRCGGQFCTEHRLPENHRCTAQPRKVSPSKQQRGRPSPRASQSPPPPASAFQRPVRRPTSPGSSFGMYAYTAVVSGFLAFISFIAGGVNLISLGLVVVCMFTAYTALKEKGY